MRFFFTPEVHSSHMNLTRGIVFLDWAKIETTRSKAKEESDFLRDFFTVSFANSLTEPTENALFGNQNNVADNLELVVTINESLKTKREFFSIRDFYSYGLKNFDFKVDFTKNIQNKCWISVDSPSTINFNFKGIKSHFIELSIFVIR